MDRPTQSRIARGASDPRRTRLCRACGARSTWRPNARVLWLRRENGQAAVEFALVVPLICVLMVAFFDFARFIDYWFDMNRVASEGARIAAVNTGTGTANDGTAVTPTSIKNRLLFDQKASSCVAHLTSVRRGCRQARHGQRQGAVQLGADSGFDPIRGRHRRRQRHDQGGSDHAPGAPGDLRTDLVSVNGILSRVRSEDGGAILFVSVRHAVLRPAGRGRDRSRQLVRAQAPPADAGGRRRTRGRRVVRTLFRPRRAGRHRNHERGDEVLGRVRVALQRAGREREHGHDHDALPEQDLRVRRPRRRRHCDDTPLYESHARRQGDGGPTSARSSTFRASRRLRPSGRMHGCS